MTIDTVVTSVVIVINGTRFRCLIIVFSITTVIRIILYGTAFSILSRVRVWSSRDISTGRIATGILVASYRVEFVRACVVIVISADRVVIIFTIEARTAVDSIVACRCATIPWCGCYFVTRSNSNINRSLLRPDIARVMLGIDIVCTILIVMLSRIVIIVLL